MVGDEISPSVSQKEAKDKYNQLLGKFRDVQAETSRSHADAPRWRYWDLFSSTFPSNIKINMDDVVEFESESMLETDSIPHTMR